MKTIITAVVNLSPFFSPAGHICTYSPGSLELLCRVCPPIRPPETTFSAAALWFVNIYTLARLPIPVRNLNLFWNIHLAPHTFHVFIFIYYSVFAELFFPGTIQKHKFLLCLRDYLFYMIRDSQFNLTCTLYLFSSYCNSVIIWPDEDAFPLFIF